MRRGSQRILDFAIRQDGKVADLLRSNFIAGVTENVFLTVQIAGR